MIRVCAVVEGQTEKEFTQNLIAPWLRERGVSIYCSGMSGNINFDRVSYEVMETLKRDRGAYVTTMLDYYGIDSDWPAVKEIKNKVSQGTKLKSTDIQAELSKSFKDAILTKLAADVKDPHPFIERFIPYFQVYEFEALFFSDLNSLAGYIGCDPAEIVNYIGGLEPEEINDKQETAPESRLKEIYQKHNLQPYKETVGCQALSERIELSTMREKCPNFNAWLSSLESLAKTK